MFRTRQFFIAFGVLLLGWGNAQADLGLLDRVVTPGNLIQKHSKYESKCSLCHKRFDKKAQGRLCVECHDHSHIGKDIKSKRGYHGRMKKQACKECHREHKGKKADIVKLEPRLFNHKVTDFPLRGKHKSDDVECKDCHKNKPYREAPSVCYSCHKKDDEHKGKLGKKCGKCHNEKSWDQAKFDHKGTKFSLRGKHKKVKCKGCHKDKRFKDKPKRTCYACHKKDDEHKGQEGKKCQSCHNAYSWKKTSFDHGLVDFPLLGKHKKVKCKKCHKTKRFKDADTDCYSCHKRDDEHKRRLGTDCGLCHSTRSWKRWKFNHNKQTDFRLDGAHKKLECLACHKRRMGKKVSQSGNCDSCHQGDDVHDGEFGRYCQRCHYTSSFSKIKSRLGF